MSQGIYPAIFQRSTTFLTKFLSTRQVVLLSNMAKTDCPCTGQYFQTGKENAICNIYSLKARLMTRSNMQKKSKIGALYEEIFQKQGVVPGPQNGRRNELQS